jgi:hypothetical protein
MQSSAGIQIDNYTGLPYDSTVRVRVFATSRYEKEVRRLFAESEQAAMQLAIAADPEAHLVVAGTGGVRKARWTRRVRAKAAVCASFSTTGE